MAQSTPTSSQSLGHYALRKKLGTGAMGEVWLAHDKLLDREVAIKLLHAGASNDRMVKNFLREAQATAKLNHPNTVTIYQIGKADEKVFIAMEYVEGGSLADELQNKGALPWREATQAVRDAAAGIKAAHERGLVHRDIKPSNLMRSSSGLVKVVDFGLAMFRGRNTDMTLTTPGMILGSPAYMSPEQCRGETADARSDLYSLTCTYYQLLTRQTPFAAAETTAVMYQHCHEPFPDPVSKGFVSPEGVCRILARGSRKNPEERDQTAAELIADLDAVLDAPEASHIFNSSTATTVSNTAAGGGSGRLVSILNGKGILKKTTWALVALTFAGLTWMATRRPAPTPIPGRDDSGTQPAGNSTGLKPTAGGGAPDRAEQTMPLTGISLDLGSGVSMKLVPIPAGKFMMGSPETEEGHHTNETLHQATLSRAFRMATTTVTQAQWKAVMGDNPSHSQGNDLPVERVSWDDAVKFCEKLSAKEGKHFRLPTEAEWEYACRAGTQTSYGGTNNLEEMGWYQDNSNKQTHPVAQKKPNAWGLYDMQGNVSQWCSDGYGPYGGDAVDPKGGSDGTSRVLRGGSWINAATDCRAAFRRGSAPGNRGLTAGFRICLDF